MHWQKRRLLGPDVMELEMNKLIVEKKGHVCVIGAGIIGATTAKFDKGNRSSKKCCGNCKF